MIIIQINYQKIKKNYQANPKILKLLLKHNLTGTNSRKELTILNDFKTNNKTKRNLENVFLLFIFQSF